VQAPEWKLEPVPGGGFDQLSVPTCSISFRRAGAAGVTDPHGVDHRVDLAPPEVQEALDPGEVRRLVERLPQELLQQGRMVGHVIDDLRRGQAVASQLQFELGAHAVRSDGLTPLAERG
jgi:hypothetical protein